MADVCWWLVLPNAWVGTVQVLLATPANVSHRAEISKLLMHPDARRKSVARSLMQQPEAVARDERHSVDVRYPHR